MQLRHFIFFPPQGLVLLEYFLDVLKKNAYFQGNNFILPKQLFICDDVRMQLYTDNKWNRRVKMKKSNVSLWIEPLEKGNKFKSFR